MSSSIFPNFTIFVKSTPNDYYSSFVSADFGNRLEVKPNAMAADDALMPQCATAHCACMMEATLTRETSELIGPDLWSPNRMAFRTSAVTVLLCYFIYLHESNLKRKIL